MPLIEDGLWQELAFRYKWKPVATGRIFKTRGDSSCQTENVICVAYCLNCQKQGVSSAVSWKPRLRNYKSHIKNNMKSCKIVRHFIEEYKVASNLRFINFDVLNNVDHFSSDEIEVLLLQKEKKQFWIGTLVIQHKGLNGTHDWKRTKRFWKQK